MSKNFLIMSLLGSNDDEPKTPAIPVVEIAPKPNAVVDMKAQAQAQTQTSRGSFLGNLVSQFQTSFGVPGGESGGGDIANTSFTNSTESANGAGSPLVQTHIPKPHQQQQTQQQQSTLNQFLQKPNDSRALSMSPTPSKARATTPKSRPVNQHVKRFQTNFNFDPMASPVNSKSSSPTPSKPISKTSITSLINMDEEGAAKKSEINPATSNNNPSGAPAPKKRKQAASKKDGDSKKQKTDTSAESGKKAKQSLMSIKEMMNDTPSSAALKLTPTLTAERDTLKHEDVTVSKPSVVEVSTADKDKKEKNTTKEKKKEVVEMPIIVLNVPLLDPKKPQPGRSEVVVNVLKLAEDKYGWNVLHPQAKNAFEYMEDLIEDDDDGSGDDDEEVLLEAARKKEEENLTPEQLARRHQTKMNRKVGKYDYEDPFIDDEELQMEEEITSTKEGFFVYWGPLVDDRTATTKKGSSKSKK